MKKLFKLFVIGIGLLSLGYSAPDITISAVVPMPGQVVQNTVLNNLQYLIKNTNLSSTYSVTFNNLNSVQGKTFTTNCGSLSPLQTCLLNITFNVPMLPAGVTTEFYPHTFFVLGAPSRYPVSLSTTIIKSSTNINPTFNVSLPAGVSCAGQLFSVKLQDKDGVNNTYDNVPCGTYLASGSGLSGGSYFASVTPETVTISSQKYNAPAVFTYHLAKQGDVAAFPYTADQTIPVNTVITAPHLISGSLLGVSCNGAAGTYSGNQAVGTTAFNNMVPGSYTCHSANYVGDDDNTYTSTIANPVTINASSSTITATYAEVPPSTIATTTNLTLPSASPGTTVACTLEDGAHTYGPKNQPSGSSPFDTVVDASDYNFSCANYTVGSDTYSMTPQTNVLVDATHNVLSGVFSKNAPPGSNYNYNTPHMPTTIADNMFAVWIGGGSTTALVKISSNPQPDSQIVTWNNAYQLSPIAILPTAYVKEFPHTMSIGSIGEDTAAVTDQLKLIKIQSSFHYEGNGSGDRGAFWDGPGGYTPQVDALAAQEAAVKTATGNQIINGTAFYTIDYSDGAYAISQDTTVDDNIIAHEYNLMYEAWRMEYQYAQGNPMVLIMNPDATEPFQNCSINYCASAWKPGIAKSATVLAAPNLQSDIDAAIDRMVTKGYLTSVQGAAMKADLVSNNIVTPPSGSGRTQPGLPEIVLSNSWAIKYLAPHIAFGYGNNPYDSSNAMLQPSGNPSYETSDITWIHKILRSGLTPTQVTQGVQFEAQKYANYLKDMNLVGTPSGNYKPDFLYFDRYERDVSPSEVAGGYLFDGADWDLYTQYIYNIDQLTGNLPWAYWQMPGATLHVASSNKKNKVSIGTLKTTNNVSRVKKEQLKVSQLTKIERFLHFGDTTPVSVTLTAPSLPGSVQITMQDWAPGQPGPATPHTYTHNVSPGSSSFDTMYYPAGQWQYNYWLVGANYTGSDGKTYWPVCMNPYGISNNLPSFSINYAYPVAVTSTSWMPNFPTSSPPTISVTLSGNCYAYTENITPGTTQPFSSAVVPDTYLFTGGTYVGSDNRNYLSVVQPGSVVKQTGSNNVFMPWGALGDDFGDWFFGNTALHNDMSNLDPSESMNYVLWTAYLNTNRYYTANSNVKDERDYLKLTSSSP